MFYFLDKMKENRIDILISKYLRKVATTEEQKSVEDWRGKSEANQAYFAQMEKVEATLAQMDFVADAETDLEWDKLKGKLEINEHEETPIRSLRPNYRRYLAIAAALAALLVISWLILPELGRNNATIVQQYQTPKGLIQEFQLPDGSRVALNADSKLEVAKQFGKKERRVSLQGEAYFEVAKNPDQPFIVQTGDVVTQVLGTAFNLRAYPESPEIELSVTEGKVAFKTRVQEGLVVSGSNAARFDKQSEAFQTVGYEGQQVASWKDGGIYFKDTPLQAIFTELERRFDVKIVNQSTLGEEAYSANLGQIDTPDQLLDILSVSFNLTYSRSGDVITITQK